MTIFLFIPNIFWLDENKKDRAKPNETSLELDNDFLEDIDENENIDCYLFKEKMFLDIDNVTKTGLLFKINNKKHIVLYFGKNSKLPEYFLPNIHNQKASKNYILYQYNNADDLPTSIEKEPFAIVRFKELKECFFNKLTFFSNENRKFNDLILSNKNEIVLGTSSKFGAINAMLLFLNELDISASKKYTFNENIVKKNLNELNNMLYTEINKFDISYSIIVRRFDKIFNEIEKTFTNKKYNLKNLIESRKNE
jgi:hypothetical protein